MHDVLLDHYLCRVYSERAEAIVTSIDRIRAHLCPFRVAGARAIARLIDRIRVSVLAFGT